jgi:hypothetical protein
MKLEKRKKQNIKVKRKKILHEKRDELAFIYDILPPKEIKKIAKKIAGIKKYKSKKEKILAFSWRFSLAGFLIVCFFTGFAPIRLIQNWITALSDTENVENEIVIFYPINCNGKWQNSEKVLGQTDVTSGGSFYDFNDLNSASYIEGNLTLTCQSFEKYVKEEVTKTNEATEQLPEQESNFQKSEENQNLESETKIEENQESEIMPQSTTEQIITENEKNEGLQESAQTQPESETQINGNQDMVEPSVENTENQNSTSVKETNNPSETNEIPTETRPERIENADNSNETTSFLERIKKYFSNFNSRAQEKEDFGSVKIKFSFATGEIKPDLLKNIEKQEINEEAEENQSSDNKKENNNIENTNSNEIMENSDNNEIKEVIEEIKNNQSTDEVINEETTSQERATSFKNFFNNFFREKIVKAQEETNLFNDIINEATDKIETIVNTEITDNEIKIETTSEEKSIEEEKQFVNIWYSLDGETWWQLDKISKDYLSNALNGGYFEYDLPLIKSNEDIQKLQIKFEGVSKTDNNFIFYLDSVWLEEKYEKTKEPEVLREEIVENIPNNALSPDFENSQIKKDVQEENLRAVIFERAGFLELWYYVTNTDPNIPSELTTGWTLLKSNGSIDYNSPLAIKDGNIFWLDSCKQTIFGFSVEMKSLFGSPVNQAGEESFLEFKDRNNGQWKAVVINNLDGDKFEFVQVSP